MTPLVIYNIDVPARFIGSDVTPFEAEIDTFVCVNLRGINL